MFHLGFSLLTFSLFSPSGASAFNFSFRRATLQKREVPTGAHIYISYIPTCKAMNLNVLKTQCYICFPGFFLIQKTRDRVRKRMLLPYHRKRLFSFFYFNYCCIFTTPIFIYFTPQKSLCSNSECFCVHMKNPNNRPIMI